MARAACSSRRSNASSGSWAFHLARLAFGLGVDDHRSPAHVRVTVAAAHPAGTVTAALDAVGVVGDFARDVLPGFGIGLMCEYPGEAMVRNAGEHAFSNRCAEYRFDRRGTANAGSTAWSSSRSMANGLPTTMAQSGPVRFARCSHRFCPIAATRLCRAGPSRSSTTGWRRWRAGADACRAWCSRAGPRACSHRFSGPRWSRRTRTDGIPVARPRYMAVGLHPPAVRPVRHLVRHWRQRDQQRPLPPIRTRKAGSRRASGKGARCIPRAIRVSPYAARPANRTRGRASLRPAPWSRATRCSPPRACPSAFSPVRAIRPPNSARPCPGTRRSTRSRPHAGA